MLEGWLDGVTTFDGEPDLPAVKEYLGISSFRPQARARRPRSGRL